MRSGGVGIRDEAMVETLPARLRSNCAPGLGPRPGPEAPGPGAQGRGRAGASGYGPQRPGPSKVAGGWVREPRGWGPGPGAKAWGPSAVVPGQGPRGSGGPAPGPPLGPPALPGTQFDLSLEGIGFYQVRRRKRGAGRVTRSQLSKLGTKQWAGLTRLP